MKILQILLLLVLFALPKAQANELLQQEALGVAERFVVENGYTDASRERIKKQLVLENIELSSNTEEILRQRFNSLKAKAIGLRKKHRRYSDGWSVAFEYVGAESNSSHCRIVTMKLDGTELRIEHVDGRREYFEGFKSE
jgi:hypothetical protein